MYNHWEVFFGIHEVEQYSKLRLQKEDILKSAKSSETRDRLRKCKYSSLRGL